jgi:ADP-heptose:LPS heptosyltransferase
MPATVAQRSLVLFPGSLGDFVCFMPALGVLSRGQQVDLFARSEFTDLAPSHVRVRALECYEISRLFMPGSAEETRLRDFFDSYSSIFSWTGSGSDTFVQQLESVSRGRARVFPFQPKGLGIHQADYYLACIGEPSLKSRIEEIPLKPAAIAWGEDYWRRHFLERKQVLTLAPGSGAREKNWPKAFFQSVGNWWRRRTSSAVVIVVGPVEEERGDSIALSRGAVVARELRLGQLAALLARSDLYLGNDSGVTHLAAALGIATVALFGPSDVRQWAPRGKRVTVVRQTLECSPCTLSAMKSCAHRKCLNTLAASEVIEKLERLTSGSHLDKGGAQGLN